MWCGCGGQKRSWFSPSNSVDCRDQAQVDRHEGNCLYLLSLSLPQKRGVVFICCDKLPHSLRLNFFQSNFRLLVYSSLFILCPLLKDIFVASNLRQFASWICLDVFNFLGKY